MSKLLSKKREQGGRKVGRRPSISSISNKKVYSRTTSVEWKKWLEVVRNFYRLGSIPVAVKRVQKAFRVPSTSEIVENQANTVLVEKEDDNRPYVSVRIFGRPVVALLDSGASRSVIGKTGIHLLNLFNVSVQECPDQIVSTADGTAQKVIGYVNLPIQVDNVVKLLKLLVVPSLSHSFILGADFCRDFDITLDFRTNSYLVGKNHLNVIDRQLECGTEVGSVNKICSRSELDEQQSQQLNDIIENFSLLSPSGLGRTNRITHKIDTGDTEPIKQRHHVMSPYKLEVLNKELDKMLELKVVRPSTSPWASPVLVVEKPNGESRFCFDGRKLNSVTKKCAYPLPMVDHILNKLSGARFLSSIDLKAAFWQIPLDPESCEKTAFVVPGRGLFEFEVMPFGLCNAAQSQQKLMDSVLGPDLDPFVFVYLDDVIIATPSFEQHLEVLKIVFDRLRAANLTINIDKCAFCLSSLKYLGFLVDREGLRTDPSKVKAMLEYPVPKTATEVKRFIGMCSWYRRFVKDYSTITAPVNALLKGRRKSQKVTWSEEADNAFRQIKQALVSAPILSAPDFSKPFFIQCDASNVGLGAILTQKDDDKELVVAFASRSLTDIERKYTVTEKECLAVLFGVEKFRPFVDGIHFTVMTDHSSLLWLSNLKNPTGRLARWAMRLSQYDMEIVHRKGALNVIPDALSRAPIETCVITVKETDVEADPWYKGMLQKVVDFPEKYSEWKVENGSLYKHVPFDFGFCTNLCSWKLVIPKGQRLAVYKSCHEDPKAAHLGVYKTVNRIREVYYWPRLLQDVRKYVRHCKTCAAQKVCTSARPGLMGQPKKVNFPWQFVSVDLLGPLPRSKNGFCYLLLVSDYFTKFCLLHPLREAKAPQIVKFLEEQVFLMYGTPQIIACDNGVQFTGKAFRKLADEYGVRIYFNASFHAQVNAVERVNRVLGAAIRSYLKDTDHRNWDQEICKIGFALRTAVHEATGYSPTFLNFGRYVPTSGDYYGKLESLRDLDLSNLNRKEYSEEIDKLPQLYSDVRRHLAEAYIKYAKHYNLRKRPSKNYHVGDKVWKRNYVLSNRADHFAAKLAPKFILCKVRKVVSKLVYELIDLNGKRVGRFHVKDLKPYNGAEVDE